MRRAPYLFPLGARLGVDNLVLRARAARHRVANYAGPLSIKTVSSGEVGWLVRGRELRVDPSSFLVLPAGERYSMNIDAEQPVETCCGFFAPGFVERIALDLTVPLALALDDPEATAPPLPYLAAWHSDRGRAIQNRLGTLARRCSQTLAPSGLEEEFISLAVETLHLYHCIRERIAGLPPVRAATREDLFRRLSIGREYLHSHSFGPVSLAAVSRAAGMSLFHFHRSFTCAFGQTPHSYLTELRLLRARRSLQSGSSVLEAALEAGFESASAFSRLFRARWGELPSHVSRKISKIGQHG